MALGLYAAAAAMVIGGFLAIYFGSDIIVMERGWTMVIAGSVFAATGALLAGVATAVARLQELGSEFARISDRLGRAPAAPARAPDERPSVPPVIAVPPMRSHGDLDITPEPILSAPPLEPAAGPLPADEIPPPRREPPPIVAERETRPVARPPEPAPEPEPEPEVAPTETVEEPSAPAIVGTYNSGGNFYIMYSDGSIEAETPAGKFRFNSLDELKDFIAAGGDKAKATS